MSLRINITCFILFISLCSLFLASGSSVFSRNYYGIKEAFEDDIPQGASTLAFVFDITGSMYDDLVQVIEGAARILSTILARREKAIHNYVLVPFHDPDIGPVTVTTDPDLFQRHLKELYVQGGGDCPEMSIGAIKLALEVCLPNSHIYVFTDARAKDYYLLNDVLKLIQRKQSQVVFVMTGDCGNHSHPGYQAYERIASTSSGQVFHLMKSDVDEVLNFVRVSLQARKVNLFAVDRPAGDLKEFEFDVDGSLREFTISVSGEKPVITLINSKGEVVDQTKGLLDLLSHKNISIVNIKDPDPGRWKLRVHSEGAHTIRTTGLSKIDFVHGFSRQPTANMKETYHRPLKGAPTYLLVNATDLPAPATFENVKLVDLEGNNLQNIPLHRFPGSNLFNASTFIPPNEYFYLKVAGSDENGYPIERMTSTAISSQLPDIPEVNTRPHMNGYYEEDTDLHCYIQSLVPFSVTWYKEGVQISQEQHFPQTTEVILTVPEVTLLSEGYYSCNATNIAGRASSTIFLDVKEPPPSITIAGNVSGIIGGSVVLPCEVDSVVDYSITWNKLIPDPNNIGFMKTGQIPDEPRFTLYSNDSLVIKNLLPKDEGWYRCSASNDGGIVQENIYLHSFVPPVVKVTPSSKNFKSGDFINITCEVAGFPLPIIRWMWNPSHNKNFVSGRSEISRNNLLIHSADAEDEGRYDCIGTNSAGSQVASVSLSYIEAPSISLPDRELIVKNGEQANLRCIAEGIPDPNVRWFKETIEIQPLSYIQISSDGSLIIYDVQETDAGKYTCFAENEAGNSKESMFLSVGSKPSLIRLPATTSVEVLQNISIPCIATGTPSPSITWHFSNGSEIVSFSKISVSNEGSLFIKEATPFIAGKYICKAQNKFGTEEQSVDVIITGIKIPVLSPLPASIQIPKGEKHSVSCIVLDGNPVPNIVWLRDGKPIQPGYGIEVNYKRLEILQADERHEATYTCHASNIGGNASEETYINVLHQPVIHASNQEFETVEGSRLTLKCNVDGDPQPTIIWLKNDIELISNDDYLIDEDKNLNILKATEDQEGEYVCSATNIIGTSNQSFKVTVKIPPKILQFITMYNATEGEMITLPCHSYAKPPAQIKWTRITEPNMFVDLEKYTVYNGSLLLKVSYSDSGRYICQASNEVGTTQIETILNVHVPPYTQIQAPSVVVSLVGDKLSVFCKTSGIPKPQIFWTKDEKNISSSTISIINGNLTILNASVHDEGEYQCIAENIAGTFSDKRRIIIHDLPKISTKNSSPTILTAVVGDQLDIVCQATGHPLPEITWNESKNSKIHNIQDNVLHIPFVQESDAGTYTCTAQNVAGFDTRIFNLSVYAPPKFTSNAPRNMEAIAGSSVLLDCSSAAFPQPDLKWFKDGVVLPPHPQNYDFKESGQKLHFSNVSVDDNGEYICVASNVAGETSNNFKLSISDPPSFRKLSAGPIAVIKNSSLLLDCSANGYPEPVFVWRKNEQLLSIPSPGLEFTVDKSILKLNEVQEVDAGTYSCIAMNKVGSNSRDFEVSVLVPPQIQGNELEEKEEILNQNIDFDCIVSGNPFPTISWLKDGLELPNNSEKVIDHVNQKLTVHKIQERDAGVYACQASNNFGEATKLFKLNVIVPPQIEQQSITETLQVKESEKMQLKCEANGKPVPKIIWEKNGRPLSPKLFYPDDKLLSIENMRKKDAGRYVCIATNKAGSYEKDFNVIVISPPKLETAYGLGKHFPRKDRKEIFENFPIVLICPFSASPKPQFIWKKDGEIINEAINPHFSILDGGKRLEIKHAKDGHTGNYTCIAKNEAGESLQNFSVNVLVPPIVNSDPTYSLSVQENSSLSLNCSATGNPLPSVIWIKEGLELESTDDMKISDDGIKFEIDKVEAHHSGVYVCIATNVAGSDEKEFNIDVLFSPRESSEVAELQSRPIAYINKPFTLQCPLSGNPIPNIKWLKNGKEMDFNDERNVYIYDDGQKLSLLRTKTEDAALYTCVAENDVGSKLHQFSLEVLASPVIDKKNVKIVNFVKEKESVVLNCPVTGHPTPEIVWLKDSDVIPLISSNHMNFSEDFQNLQINFVSLKDSGKYTCLAGNEVGIDDLDFKIEVQVPPKLENLIDIPRNITSVLNKPLTINCPVSGIPPPSVTWLKDGKPMQIASDANIMLTSDSKQLKFFRTREADAAVYTCEAINDAGKIEKEFVLDVLVPPKLIETNSILDYYAEDDDENQNEFKVVENSTSQLECYVDGNPKPLIIWIKDGHLLNLSNDYHYELFYEGQVLQIHHIKYSDSGHYTCIASNVAGTKEKSFNVNVHVPPKLKGPIFEAQEVLLNRPTVLECQLDSVPPAVITWLKNGKKIKFSDHTLMKVLDEGHVLQFLKVMPSDDGQYSCIAENGVGKVEKHFKVDVFVPPVIQDKTFKSEFLENEKLSLECSSKGNPTPSIIWMKDGKIISEDMFKNMSIHLQLHDSVLSITEAKTVHSGQYKCIVSNVAGTAEKSFDVYVKVPPKIVNTSEPNMTVLINQPIVMHCIVESEPEAFITWSKEGQLINDVIDPFLHITDEGQKLQILRTRENDSGHYSCDVSNVIGNTSRSFMLNVLVPPKVKNLIQGEPEIPLIKGNNATIKCFIHGNPPPSVSWLKDEELLFSDSGEKMKFYNNSQILQIWSLEPHDGGQYKCVASSPLGIAEKSFNLTVLVPPSIAGDSFVNSVAHINKQFILDCITYGNPRPTITWMKNGNFIDPFLDPNIQFLEEKSIILIKWTRMEDSGKYTCIASSAAGQAEKMFNVHVHTPATIDRSNLKNEVLALYNQSTILTCPASGVPSPTITWLKDGEPLHSNLNSNLQFLEGGKTLKMSFIKENYAGIYTCLVFNDVGSDEEEFIVDVMVPPLINSMLSKRKQESKEGESLILQCPFEDSNYGLTIVWKKDGKNFKSESAPPHIEFSSDNKQIKVMKSQTEDSGIYSCIASNYAGDSEYEFELLITAPAKIIHPYDNVTSLYVKEHHSITLECNTIGHPPPVVKWKKNGIVLLEQHNTSLSMYGKLKISNALSKDAGIYSCQSENMAGIDEKAFNLTIYIPPVINISSHGLHKVALQNTEIELNCSAYGVPLPRVIWYKGSEMLISGPRISFLDNGERVKISHALVSDAGKYTCLAFNEAGDTEAELFVRVHVPPIIETVTIQGSETTPIANQSVRIHCNVHGLPFPTVSWFKNGVLIDENDSRFVSSGGGQYLDILRLQTFDSGLYSCEASNIVGGAKKEIQLTVSVPPGIEGSDRYKEYQVVLGKSMRMDCDASGMPPPIITWLKNGLPITDKDNVQLINNNYALLFTYTLENAAGTYTCIATNNAGKVEQKFNLTVLVPPSFNENSLKRNILPVVVGSSITLHCSVKGYPQPDISWLKDGSILKNDANVNIRDDYLELLNVDISHNGSYICESSNVAGKITKDFNVYINVPPKIEGGTDSTFITSIVKQSTTLKCSISGIPTPSIIWLKNGIPIIPVYSSHFYINHQGSELTIQNSELRDSGQYSCIASNSAGNASRTFTLNVLEPPIIKESPSPVKSLVGNDAILTCIADGAPQPEISWMKEGILLNNKEQFMSPEKISLSIQNVQLQDAGNYTCYANNEVGLDFRTIELQVIAPPSIRDRELSEKVLSGDSIYLPCEAFGHPSPQIMWHKDSVLIQDDENVNILSDGTLHIISVNVSYNGTYKCFAENEAGGYEVDRALNVLTPPIIYDDSPTKYEVTQAHPILIQCSAEGMPQPSIAWEHNGISIDLYNPRYKVFPSGDLHISLTQPSDMGTYTCIAKNEAGSAIKQNDLIVLVPPTVTISGPPVLVTLKGRNMLLSCSAKGFPPPHIVWQKNGIPISGASNSENSGKLIVETIQPEDSGTYVCVAANAVGRDHKSILVEVHVPPVITTLPKSQDISVGDVLSLICEATGHPFPSITWLLNNTQVAGSTSSILGRSKLIIENAGKQDEGTYICLAQNAAGERKAAAAVRIRTPPIILGSSTVKTVQIKDTVILHCLVKGDPPPNIIWIKNGQQLKFNHHIQQLQNGSLFIYDSSDQDTGQYKCVASNDFGSAEQVAELVVRSKPKFVILPHNTKITEGNNVYLDCKVNGEPKPSVTWNKDSFPISKNGRLLIFPNNTLEIVAVQTIDEGIYSCMANNSLGTIESNAKVIVQVHGKWSEWQSWGNCSVSCGEGRQVRQRYCNNPAPRNGGKTCIGISFEVKQCIQDPCPVDGDWGNWMEWQQCSVTCGVGLRQRFRKCDNPIPKYGGINCIGDDKETDSCLITKCPVDGRWSEWHEWQPCSVTCGIGIQLRTRECNNPEPLHGGQPCYGETKENQECFMEECPVNGEWSAWSGWSLCSSSCGGGIRERKRVCDSPLPAYGGHHCIGSSIQIDYCNNAQCPVNGEWGPWSVWGPCSSSCNKGQKKRFRSCDSPAPAGGGRDCSGASQETEVCNAHLCPIDGKWNEWSLWSTCSTSCGIGVHSRVRFCNSPEPSYGGKDCTGDSEEYEECGDEACDVFPVKAKGHLIGILNGVDFGLSKLSANISHFGLEHVVLGTIQNITVDIAKWMELLAPILTPIYWTTAYEIGAAVNGYTLTKGFFRKETQVSFMTGEILYVTHVARGLDRRGNLLVDIVISGEVPDILPSSNLTVHPFIEDYIQTGPGLIYALSTRTYKIGTYILPYSWNHSIYYDEAQGEMPFIIERLYVNNIESYYDSELNELQYIISAAIGKGPFNNCFEGFRLTSNNIYCEDINECEVNNSCSHICNNFPGGFSCQCLNGYDLNVDGESCNDVNECEMNIDHCSLSEECVNTVGSYKCLVICKDGYERSEDEQYCKDVDECNEYLHSCSDLCINTIGSYRCSCNVGYELFNETECWDVNECDLLQSPCTHLCTNSPGSFYCSCPKGYDLQNGTTCIDVDECRLSLFKCFEDQECKNTEGGYECINVCSQGFERASNGSCIDFDECHRDSTSCHSTQICINTFGSYYCSCRRGYYSYGPGRPCQDINECLQTPQPCSYLCRNLPGDFECICAPGFKRLPDGKSCAGIEYLDKTNHELQDHIIHQRNGSAEFLSKTNTQIYQLTYNQCLPGFNRSNGKCQDIDECEDKAKCQHICENTVGSYHCICPPGYRLSRYGKTCEDIDECLELNINCGSDQTCFNMRGSYECVETPCPPKYDRDPLTGYCKLECEKAGTICPPNVRYSEILAFKMVALPSGIQAYQDLVRLIAYDQDGIQLKNTVFSIVENETGVPFRIRLENGKGILYTQRSMESNREYQIKVQAVSYDTDSRTIQYTTKFLVFVSVSQYPY